MALNVVCKELKRVALPLLLQMTLIYCPMQALKNVQTDVKQLCV